MTPEEEVYEVADKLVRKLRRAGVVVHRKNSKSTNTVYLKLDEGMAFGVRISDHEDAVHRPYLFNIITTGFKEKARWNGITHRFYFKPDGLYRCINKILKTRSARIKTMGIARYKALIQIRKRQSDSHTKTGGF